MTQDTDYLILQGDSIFPWCNTIYTDCDSDKGNRVRVTFLPLTADSGVQDSHGKKEEFLPLPLPFSTALLDGDFPSSFHPPEPDDDGDQEPRSND